MAYYKRPDYAERYTGAEQNGPDAAPAAVTVHEDDSEPVRLYGPRGEVLIVAKRPIGF